MAYEEINPGIWTYEVEGDFVEGIFVKAEKNVGPQNSMMYHLEVEEKPMSIWGSAILDQRMMWAKPGDKTKITYKGLAEATIGKKPAKIFKVEIDRA